MSSPYYKRVNIRRLRNGDRQRFIRIMATQHDGPAERKIIERQWEHALDLHAEAMTQAPTPTPTPTSREQSE